MRDGASDKLMLLVQAVVRLAAGLLVGFHLNFDMAMVMLLVMPFTVLVVSGSALVSGRVFTLL